MTKQNLAILTVITILLFSYHKRVKNYHEGFRKMIPIYLSASKKPINERSYTANLSNQLSVSFPTLKPRDALQKVYIYFEQNGSLLVDVKEKDFSLFVKRQLANSGNQSVGFYFVKNQKKWQLDSIGNLNVLVKKMNCMNDTQK